MYVNSYNDIVIDIYDEVDRWLITYIVYHTAHSEAYEDDLNARAMFTQERDIVFNSLENLERAELIKLTLSTARTKTDLAAMALKLDSELISGNLLERTLDLIASLLNEGIQAAGGVNAFNDFEVIAASGIAAASNLSNKSSIDNFFISILDALKMATNVDANVLAGLTGLGQLLTGDPNYNIPWKSSVAKIVTQTDLRIANNVVTKLANAITGGKINEASFPSIVSNIFYKTIGDRIVKGVVSAGFRKIDHAVMTELGQLNTKNNRFIADSGREISAANGASVVSVFNLRAFLLSVQSENDEDYTIDIGANTIGGWKEGKNPGIFFNVDRPLGTLFGPSTERTYLAYNTLMHALSTGDFLEAYKALRSSIAGSFFMDSGFGGSTFVKTGTMLDKALFVLLRGQVYPIYTIIKNICKKAADNEILGFNGLSNLPNNRWKGQGPSVGTAILRSNLINKVLNSLVVGLSLNSDILYQFIS